MTIELEWSGFKVETLEDLKVRVSVPLSAQPSKLWRAQFNHRSGPWSLERTPGLLLTSEEEGYHAEVTFPPSKQEDARALMQDLRRAVSETNDRVRSALADAEDRENQISSAVGHWINQGCPEAQPE